MFPNETETEIDKEADMSGEQAAGEAGETVAGDMLSSGVGGTDGGQPLHVREQIVHVGAWHLRGSIPVGDSWKGHRKTAITYRAHWTSWLCLTPGNARWQEAQTTAFVPSGGALGRERGESWKMGEVEWASLRRLSACILRPLEGSDRPIVALGRVAERRSAQTRLQKRDSRRLVMISK